MKTTKYVQHEARQLFRWCRVDGKLQEDRVLEVSNRVLQSKRRGYFRLLSCFYRLVKLESAKHSAEVQSAAPLPFNLARKLQGGLADLYGPNLTIRFAREPALIGGIRIKVGSDVYDGSVQSRLQALERCF